MLLGSKFYQGSGIKYCFKLGLRDQNFPKMLGSVGWKYTMLRACNYVALDIKYYPMLYCSIWALLLGGMNIRVQCRANTSIKCLYNQL